MTRSFHLLLLAAVASFAQMSVPGPSATPGLFPALGRGSEQPVLTDPSRIQMKQSVTFSASSGGGSSFSQSLYTNQIIYRLTDPLTLHLDLGILTPMTSSGPAAEGLQKGAYLIPDIGLEYRPSESVLFLVKYSSIPSAPVGSPGGLPWR